MAATSNTLPEQLGEGRFAAQDFPTRNQHLAKHFSRPFGSKDGLRHRDLPPAPEPWAMPRYNAPPPRFPARRWTTSSVVAQPGDHASVRYLTLTRASRGVHTGVHPIDDQECRAAGGFVTERSTTRASPDA